jgi:hypothetical protein
MRRLAFAAALLMIARPLLGQEDPGRSPADSATVADSVYGSSIAGEFRPAKGFDLFRSDKISLNISFYGLFRYVNQLPGEQTFTDHLGRERTVKARNDLNWHRTMVWLTGFAFTPRFRYNITLWSLPTTQQTLLFGNLQYHFNKAMILGVGITPNLTARSTQGSWPFWGSSDRQMAEDFFRGGFSSGVFITGQSFPRLYHTFSLNTNISQLGVVAANDTRDLAYSGSLNWMPTTGEFGPRGGFGDMEYHEKVATRFGASAGHSREARYANETAPPNASQIKLSDGINPFDADALVIGATVDKLTYNEFAVDAGLKYRGWTFQAEFFRRRLSDFLTTDGDLLPLGSITDQGFQVQANYMVVPKTVALYATYGRVNDQFERDPSEFSWGASFYPAKNRSWRLNSHFIHIERSPAASNFGFYTSGQTGTTVSLGVDILM